MESKILKALDKIGKHHETRELFLDFLLSIEKNLVEKDCDIREEVIGPIVDGIYSNSDVLHRTLENGLDVFFPYSSKICREFLMANAENLDHVWEPQTTKLLLHLSKDAKHILIGGAYWGDQALLIADSVRLSGLVHCFEINKRNLAFLRKNIYENHLNNILVMENALWDFNDVEVKLLGKDSLETCVEISDSDENGFITKKIDTYGNENNIDSLDLIMLDIEGAELRVLKGAEFYLSQPKEKAPNLVFEIHKNYVDWSCGLKQTEIISYLCNHGYILYAIRDYNANVSMRGKPIELVPLDDIYLNGPPHGFNILGVKDISILKNNLFLTTPGVSPKLLRHKDPKIHAPLF